MKTSGFFKLHRSMFDNPAVMKDADYFITWVYILAQAEWEDGKKVDFGGETIELKAGQFTTGVSSQMLDDLKKVNNDLNTSKLNRILKRFKTEQQIEQRTDHQCSLFTVLNWDRYQNSEQRNEQRVNNDRTTSEQRVNTNKEYKEKKEDKEVKKKDLLNISDDIFNRPSDTDKKHESLYQEYLDLWNSLKSYGIAPLRAISEQRAKLLKPRLEMYGKDSFAECIEEIKQSDFLQGKHGGKPWTITFDWMIKPSNYPKVLEGNYRNKNDSGGNNQQGYLSDIMQMIGGD